MRDLVPNGIDSLRLAESLTVRACEVYYEDETPHRIPLREAAYAFHVVHEGLGYLRAYRPLVLVSDNPNIG